MKKTMKAKSLSAILTIVLLLQIVAPGAFTVNGEVQELVPSREVTAQEASVSPIVGEAEELREENAKHFQYADGSTATVLYANPVHYKENGVWKDIDTSLILSAQAMSASNKATYVPKEGTIPISIPQNLADGQKITLSSKGYTVGFGVSAANETVSLDSAASLTAVATNSNSSAETAVENGANDPAQAQQEIIRESNDEMMALEKLSSAVVYSDVFPDTDLEYIVSATGIKENIIVNSPQAAYVYRFDMDLDGLVPVEQDDGSILLCEQGSSEEAVFVMHAPYMYDANGAYSEDVTMTLAGAALTVEADAEWINDAGRVWPVVIDPYIEELSGSSAIIDAHVSSSWLLSGINYDSSINLYAGKLATGSFNRSYIKFNLPTIPSGNIITSAQFDLKKWDLNTGSHPILVYDAHNYNWTSSALKFNNQPLSKNANGLKNVSNLPLLTSNSGLAPDGQWYNINVTQAVNRWYQSNGSNGLVITSVSETVNGQAAFHSSNTIADNEKPVLTIKHMQPSDRTHSFIDDAVSEVLTKPSSTYSQVISEVCVELACDLAYHKYTLEDVLMQADFVNFADYDYGKNLWGDMTDNRSPHSFAMRTEGETTIVTVVLMGTGTEYGLDNAIGRWVSNLNGGTLTTTNGIHAGFKAAADRVHDNLEDYLSDAGLDMDDENLRFLITGYSRGASIGNVLSAMLNEAYGGTNSPDTRVYNYNFAAPNTIRKSAVQPNQNVYANVFNICNEWDPFTYFPFNNFVEGEWDRYGKTLWFIDSSKNTTFFGAHSLSYIDYILNVADQSLENVTYPSKTIIALEAWWTALTGGTDTAGTAAFTADQLATIHLLFDAELYALNNNLPGASYEQLWTHFITNMEANTQLLNTFSRVYHYNYYLAQNPNQGIPNSPLKTLKHFITQGMAAGLDSVSGWNVHSYRANYTDLENAFGNDLKQYYIHFCVYGYNEGRSGV